MHKYFLKFSIILLLLALSGSAVNLFFPEKIEAQTSSITFGGITSTAPATDTNNITFTAPVISGSNTALVVCAMVNNASASFSSATYDGVSMGSPLTTLNVSATTLGCWVVKNPASAKTIIINTSIVRKVSAFAAYYTGVDQTITYRTVTTATGTSNPATVTVTNSQSGDLIVGAFGLNDTTNANGMSSARIGVGQTFRLQTTNSSSEAAISMGEEDGAASAVVHSWDFVNNTDNGWAEIAIPLIPADISPSVPVISSFSASPTSIPQGNSSTLSWSVSGNPTPTLSIDNGVGAVTGSSINVSPSVTTTYTLTATNSQGNTTAQTTVIVTAPPPPDTTAPSVPTNLSATAISSSQINLSWTASTDNIGVTGYDIYRGGTLLTSVTSTSYSNTGLSASTLYSYTVRAKDAAGNNSTQSSSASATTQPASTSQDKYVRKGASGNGTSWADAYGDFNNVNWTGMGGATLWIAGGNYTRGLPGLTLANVTVKRATVAAHGTNTGWSDAYDAQVTVTPPSGENFLVMETSATSFVLDGAGYNPWKFRIVGVRGYDGVIRNEGANGVVIRGIELDGMGEVTNSGEPEDGLRWMGGSNNIIEYNYIHDYRQVGGAHNDGVQGPSCTNITFRYNKFKNNGMHIFLGDYEWGNQYCNGISIHHNIIYNDTNGGSYNGVVFKGTNQGGSYTNKIENNVFNLRGQGSALYLANSPSPGCCNNLANSYFRNNIVYSSDAGTVSYYSRSNNIYYNSSAPTGESGTLTSNPLFTDVANNIYTLQATSPAINAGASLGYTQDIIGTAISGVPDIGAYEFIGGDTTASSVPINLSATAISSSQINLSWTASTDAVGVTGYRIYRGGVQIGTSITNNYNDNGLNPSTLYSYTVSAYDAAGNNSSQSTSASATTQSGQPVPGDLNSDHIVNALDYSLLNSKWLQSFSAYDLQADGLINSLDFAILSSNWGKTW